MQVLMILVYLLIFELVICEDIVFHEIVSWSYVYLQFGKFRGAFTMFINLNETDTFLFSNMEKETAKFSKLDPNNTFFEKTLYLNNRVIENFPFYIKKDRAEIYEREVDGVLGLGMKNGKNYFIDYLKSQSFIDKRTIFIRFGLIPEIKFINDLTADELTKYHYCQSKHNISGWSCDLSHLTYISTDGNEVKITLPRDTIIKYNPSNMFFKLDYDTFYSILTQGLNIGNKCKDIPLNQNESERIILCENEKEKYGKIIMNIGGIGIEISNDVLFNSYNNNQFLLMICFVKNMGNVISAGFGLFNENWLSLDFDNNQIGFKKLRDNSEYIDYSKEYEEWKKSGGKEIKDEKKKQRFNKVFIITICIVIPIGLFIILYRRNKKQKIYNNFVEGIQDVEPIS